VRSYKSLAQVERAFRSMKTVDLEIRPVFHWTVPRVRAHVLLCMLVPRVVHNVGFNRFNLTRASAVVNCQSALA
jgi:transposase